MKPGQLGQKKGVIECPEFDLRLTLESGQTFHWMPVSESKGGGYTGCIGKKPVWLRQEGQRLHYQGNDGDHLPDLIRHYFAFDHDLDAIRDSCSGHPASFDAAIACHGLRIMRQPHWECIASFILSPMKQVAHIRQMSLALRETFGKKLPGFSVPAFPEPQVLASATEEQLRQCGLGFRAKGLLGSSRLISSGAFDPEDLISMSTEEARSALCSLPGIGRKVANCILALLLRTPQCRSCRCLDCQDSRIIPFQKSHTGATGALWGKTSRPLRRIHPAVSLSSGSHWKTATAQSLISRKIA
jgi:N-glycosylase/DNA lyase